jgi:hypothetical protein
MVNFAGKHGGIIGLGIFYGIFSKFDMCRRVTWDEWSMVMHPSMNGMPLLL